MAQGAGDSGPGLCLGHDTLFIKSSCAPVTLFVARDRVTGHNPVTGLYQAHGYQRKRVFGEPAE